MTVITFWAGTAGSRAIGLLYYIKDIMQGPATNRLPGVLQKRPFTNGGVHDGSRASHYLFHYQYLNMDRW